jgi:hypothetical protein
MNNDGHAAALNRDALMSLLMGRHRWFVALGGFFFAGRAPPGPVSPSLPSGWQARPGGARHGVCVAGSPSLLVLTRTPEQARAVAAFNPTQCTKARRQGAERRGREGGGGEGGAFVCGRGYLAASPRYLLFHITTARVLNMAEGNISALVRRNEVIQLF